MVLIAGFAALGTAFVAVAVFAAYGGLPDPESLASRIAATTMFGGIGLVFFWCAIAVLKRRQKGLQ